RASDVRHVDIDDTGRGGRRRRGDRGGGVDFEYSGVDPTEGDFARCGEFGAGDRHDAPARNRPGLGRELHDGRSRLIEIVVVGDGRAAARGRRDGDVDGAGGSGRGG